MNPDLLFDKRFSEYRQAEIKEASKIVADMFHDNANPEYIKGALALMNKILHLPGKYAYSEEAKIKAQELIEKSIKAFEADFIRIHLE
ncbi:MAG: hypothetical protein ABIA66_03675 [Candidatus Omnitrophota bacterium]